MSFPLSAEGQKRIRVQRPPGTTLVVKWPDLTMLLQSILRAMGWQLQIDGAESIRTDAGGAVNVKVPAGGGTSAPSQGLDVSSDGKVIAATVMDVMPTVGGTRLDDATPPLLSLTSSGTEYIVINVSGTFSLTGGTFVLPTFSAAPTVTITVESSDPGYAGTHGVSTGEFHFLLATFVDGVKTGQNGHGPISAELCDTLTSEAKANLNLTWAGP